MVVAVCINALCVAIFTVCVFWNIAEHAGTLEQNLLLRALW
jgi:hypothetical protein